MKLRKEITVSMEMENGLTPKQITEKIKSLMDSLDGIPNCELVSVYDGWSGDETEHVKEIYFTFSIK